MPWNPAQLFRNVMKCVLLKRWGKRGKCAWHRFTSEKQKLTSVLREKNLEGHSQGNSGAVWAPPALQVVFIFIFMLMLWLMFL